MADLKPIRLKITSLNLLNDEALTLNWASNSKHQDLDVEYTINFYKKGDSSSPLMTISGLRLADQLLRARRGAPADRQGDACAPE